MAQGISNKALIAMAALGGGIIGVLVVRGFFLDRIEELGWRMFWSGLGNGRLMNLGTVVQSATFAKCVGGFLVLGIATALVVKAALNKYGVQN